MTHDVGQTLERFLRTSARLVDAHDDARAIMIDPARRFGRPVLAATNIETAVVAERFVAGELAVSLAVDFEVDASEIEEAVRFESQLRAA